MGIDLSFRGPAAVIIPPDWDMEIRNVLALDGVEEVEGEGVYQRMARIAFALLFFAQQQAVRHIWIEQYAFGLAKRAHGSILMEQGGILKHTFCQAGLEIIPVHSSPARRFLFGQLPRKDIKVFVQAQLYAMGAPHEWTDNAVDAMVVANYGRGQLGLRALAVG